MLVKVLFKKMLGFAIVTFNIGFILSFYLDFGYDLIMLGGLSTSILILIDLTLDLPIQKSRIFLRLAIIAFIIYILAYTHHYPFEKEIIITSLILLCFWIVPLQINGSARGEILAVLNGWQLRISAAILVIYFLLPIIGMQYHEYLLFSIALLISYWSIEHLIIKTSKRKNSQKNSLLFLLPFLILSQTGIAQICVINHEDEPVRIYKKPDLRGEAIGQIQNGNVFFFDPETDDYQEDWVKIWIPSNLLSKLYEGQEHGVSGFVHRSKIKKLEETSKTGKKDILLIFETAQTFVSNKSIDKQGYVDGLFPYGSEGHLYQSFEIQKMQLVWQGDTLDLSPYFYNDLYNIHYKSGILTSASEKFKTYKSGNTYYIHHGCGDGGGYYEVVWVIRNGKILQRLAGWRN